MAGKTAGECQCPVCGAAAQAKHSDKNNRLYIMCPHPGDGGCGSQIFSRYTKGDEAIAAKIGRWRDDELRQRFFPEPVSNDNAPEAEPEPKKSFLDKEIF